MNKNHCLLIVFFLLSIVANAQYNSDRIVVVNGIRYQVGITESTHTGEEFPYSDAIVIEDPGSPYSGVITIPKTIDLQLSRPYYEGGTKTVSCNVGLHKDAFKNCTGLTDISINCTGDIPNGVFDGCKSLKTITVNKSNEVYDSRNGCNAIIKTSTNELIAGCKSTVIPEDVEIIGMRSFYNCIDINTISIPAGVKFVGSEAFLGCKNLNDVYCLSKPGILYERDVLGEIVDKPIFDGSVENSTLHVCDVYIEDFKADDKWNIFGKIVVIKNETDFNLVYYVDGKEYKTVQYKYDDEIVPLEYPEKEGYTFSGWSEIPTNMPGKDVKVYGTFVVNKYKLVYEIDGAEYKSFEIEYGKSIIPESVQKRDNYEFSGWSEIPKTMPAHDVTVYGYFTKISTDIDDVKYKFVGDEAYVINSSNKGGVVKILDSFVDGGKMYIVTSIESDAFKNNQNITSLILPNTIKNIGDGAFYGCANLVTVEMGESLNTIGVRAFAKIDKLTDVFVYANSVPETDRTAFENSYIEDYVTLHVPESSIEKYKATAPWKNFKEIVGAKVKETECATPTIELLNGKIVFNSTTEGVKFISEVTASVNDKYEQSAIVPALPKTFKVSVYATKDGLENSETVTKEFRFSDIGLGDDQNGDGVVNAADVVRLVNRIMNLK